MAQSIYSDSSGALRTVLRWTAALLFIAAGANHFIAPDFYRKIVPPEFPNPRLLVQISGFCEILGGAGLLVPKLRKLAGLGLIALLIAVFPANIFMAVSPEKIPDMHFPRWALWGRLPLQALLVTWVWFVAVAAPKTKIHEGHQ